MIRTELREICISIDHEPGVAAPFKWKRERQGSGETEREGVCVRVLVDTGIASVSIHKQHAEREHMETHIADILR
jgi:hypothetical protein